MPSTPRLSLTAACATFALAAGACPAWAAPEPVDVRVSLSAPDEVKRGRAADLGAVVTTQDTGERAGGVLVILYGRRPQRGAWAEADRGVTDARGVVAFRVVPKATTEYAAESLPSGLFAGATSGVVRVKVRK